MKRQEVVERAEKDKRWGGRLPLKGEKKMFQSGVRRCEIRVGKKGKYTSG